VTCYRAPSAEAMAVAELDDLAVIYHRLSGMTHVVEPLVPELLAALGEDWTSALELLERLRAQFEMPDADAGVLAARLDELVEAGLVERG
jgi:PqqD family protein of HPr-rel-A system